MKWYQTLSIHQRINLRDVCELLCGVTWDQLSMVGFTFTQKIELIHSKLKIEGFIV